MPKSARQLDEEINDALARLKAAPNEAAHTVAVNATLRKYTALVNQGSQNADDWETVHHELVRLLGPLRGDNREIVRARAEEARQRAQAIRQRAAQKKKDRESTTPNEATHAKELNVVIRKYNALSKSQDADALDTVGFELDRLMGPLHGNPREFVRARAKDAHQRATDLRRRTAGAGFGPRASAKTGSASKSSHARKKLTGPSLIRRGTSSKRPFYEIRSQDVGKNYLHDLGDLGGGRYLTNVLGHVQPGDVGKRLYFIDEGAGVLQVESSGQRDARLRKNKG